MDFLKNSMTFLVIPITLICLLVVWTGLLIERRNDLQPALSNVQEFSGVGDQTPTALNINTWYPYYGGGEGLDTVVNNGSKALRISTGGDGGWYGARADVSGVSFTDTSITFSVRFNDWNEVSRLMVLFSSGAEFANYYGINLKNYFTDVPSHEWREVVIDRSEFSVIEGSPDWNTITDIAFRVVPVTGISTRVWFDEFATIPSKNQSPVISMTFDDGFKSVMDAANIMSLYSMSGTAYVIPDFLEQPNYLTQADIDYLSSIGWDISGHGKDNLTLLSAPDVDTQLAKMYTYLAEKDYTGKEHFAYPNGGYNTSVQSQVSEYFESGRTIDGLLQPTEYMYPYNVNALTVSSSTPLTEVVDKINLAIERNGWLILVWHDFSSQPESDVQYSLADFEWVVEFLSKSEAQVLTYSEAWDKFAIQQKQEDI